jgi:hypothetical protein
MVKCKTLLCSRAKELDPSTGLCLPCLSVVNGLPNPSNMASFPSLPGAEAGIDIASAAELVKKVESGQSIDSMEYMKVTLGLLCNLSSGLGGFSKELSDVKALAQSNQARGESNEDRIGQLEAKVGDSSQCAVPLSLTMQNVEKM